MRLLRSFSPVADRRSRVLILGTMPGPEALRRREYYGFLGNHFWPIIQALFGAGGRPLSYPEKVRLVRKNGIALWDTIGSCEREGASDGAIRSVTPNDIPGLLKKYPDIRLIVLNGKLAEKLYRKHSAANVNRPTLTMPSTSPAHAAMSFSEKLKRWQAIRKMV